jgi:hypothetical protein
MYQNAKNVFRDQLATRRRAARHLTRPRRRKRSGATTSSCTGGLAMAHKMLDIAQHLYFKMIQYQFWTLPVWHWREGRSLGMTHFVKKAGKLLLTVYSGIQTNLTDLKPFTILEGPC